ncbi:MAG: head completion/stabilization protein [Caenibius sp.]
MNDIVSIPPEPASPAGATVSAGAFWPVIAIADVRAVLRIGGASMTHERLTEAVRFAMVDVTRQLTAWRVEQQANGYASLSEIDQDNVIDDKTALEVLFDRAVTQMAGAELADRYPDLTATREGADRAETIMTVADDYRRSATRAIRAILGQTGTMVELV